jgi:hypothetical protein
MINKTISTFFDSVAHHNLERFHSETIAWLFQTYPDAAKEFILTIHEGINLKSEIVIDGENDFCFAEQNQIDISLKYSFKGKEHLIIIENKLKASEHFIKNKKIKKSYDKLKLEEIEYIESHPELSQTEFYYFREKIERAEQIVNLEWKKNVESIDVNLALEILKKYSTIKIDNIIDELNSISNGAKLKKRILNFLQENFNDDYCRYVYLKPSVISEEAFKKLAINTNYLHSDKLEEFFNFKQNNHWSKALSKVRNPWKTTTYKMLVECIKNSQSIPNNSDANNVIANSYLNFIESNLSEEVNLNNFNNNKLFGQFEYFKLLFAIVKSKLQDPQILYSGSKNKKENLIYEYIEAGSSNGGAPLFAFFKKIKTDVNFNYFVESRDFINVGIQVQGNNFKYYVSADTHDYDNTKIKNQERYAEFVKPILTKLTEDFKVEYPDKNKGFNPNSTKTFYSRSYKISNFIGSDSPRNIFDIADEISKKLNAFIELKD